LATLAVAAAVTFASFTKLAFVQASTAKFAAIIISALALALLTVALAVAFATLTKGTLHQARLTKLSTPFATTLGINWK
jgi:succinate dehydrogenase hydrophobic anchor subunit